VNKASDGVGGEEGTFSLCTLWYARFPPIPPNGGADEHISMKVC
jgi:hypothetical protein